MRKFKGGTSYITAGVAIAAASLMSKPAHAAFTLVDNFNRPDNVVVGGAFASGEVDGDPTYSGLGAQVALVGNQMQIYSTTEDTYSTDLRAYTAPGYVTTATSTIFFQMTLTNAVQAPANNWNAGFAISRSANSNAHSKDLFSVFANGTGPSVPISINSGATADLTHNNAAATGASMTVGTQYNFWLVLDDTDGLLNLYENTGGAATGANLIAANIPYGNAPFTPVNLTFYAYSANFETDDGFGGNGVNGSNSFDIDNIYTDTVTNLADPTQAVPEPASLSMLGLVGGGLLIRRRRHA